MLWHARFLPEDRRSVDAPRSFKQGMGLFLDTLRTFFAKRSVWGMIAFVLLYRCGEGFLEKIGPLFMMDERGVGGLGLDNEALGHINGTFGTVGFMLGALLGGLLAARYGLRRMLLVLCLGLNIPSATYIYLAYLQPQGLIDITFWVTLEKIGWGFGSVGQMLYMMQQLAPGKYKTAHFAFGTALMALGVMIPSTLSGFIQVAMGYAPFFVFVIVASIPSVIATILAPFPIKDEEAPATPISPAPAPTAQ
jgi:PAT family beta-lactamase induction signal transducer AmpG